MMNLQPFYYPDADLSAISAPDEEVTDETTDDDAPPEESESTDEESTDETGDEDTTDDEETEETEEDKKDEEETKEDEEEKDEEHLELTSTVTDIKKEFPDFFKKFPDVKAAIFREQRYLETVGTIEQAKSAVDKAETLDAVNTDLATGRVDRLLGTLQKNSKEAFENTTFNFLPELQKLDKDAYLEAIAYPIKQLCRAAWREGNGEKTDLGKAAAHIHNFFFRNTRFEDKVRSETGRSTEETPKEREYRERLEEINKREAFGFETSVANSYVDRMTKEIRISLDKDERLSDYTRSNLTKDILRDIKEQLEKDSRYQGTLASLWKQARESGFSNDFKSRIVSTALARAKSLVPETRKRLVSKALGKKIRTEKEPERRTESRTTREPERRREVRNPMAPKKPLTDIDILRGN